MNLPKFKVLEKLGALSHSSMFKKTIAAVALFALFMIFVVLFVSKQSGDYYSQPAITMPVESIKTVDTSADLPAPGQMRNRPTNRYKAPFDETSKKPRIAIIMTGLGLQEENTKKAILELPAGTTLGFSPYGSNNQFWIDQAIQNRHEILMGIPMEPNDYPDTDPGPLTLLKRDQWEQNLEHLNAIATPYDRPIGYINEFGNAYLASDVQNRRFIDWIQMEDAIFVENLIDNTNTPLNDLSKQISADYVPSDLQIDALANTNAIVARLRKLERDAKEKGYAVGIASPYPLTIEVIKQWVKDLDKRGVILSPISSIVEKRKAG